MTYTYNVRKLCFSSLMSQEKMLGCELQYSQLVGVLHEKVLADSLLVPGQKALVLKSDCTLYVLYLYHFIFSLVVLLFLYVQH